MKDIKGYEDRYAITSCGRVWSYLTNKFLKPASNKYGYQTVVLRKDNMNHTYLVHRLVAQAYIDNPHNLPEINHKDENASHNWINNLEWISTEDNLRYGTHMEKVNGKKRKAIYCQELNKSFDGVRIAARELNLCPQSISDVCCGKQKTTGGYHFWFIEE